MSTRGWLAAIAFSAALAIIGAYMPQWPWLHWLCKPLTTLLIVGMLLGLPGAEPRYRTPILIGLSFSLLGDVMLMLPFDGFVFGLASFLCAHIAYLWALTRRARLFARWQPFAVYALVAGSVLAVLWPQLPAGLHAPVLAYVVVLAAMAAQAAAVAMVTRHREAMLAAAGGAAFVLSDASLALDRFATPFALSGVIVLSTYWLAQTLLALSAENSAR